MQSFQRGPNLDNAFHANEGQTWKNLALTRVYYLTCMAHNHNPNPNLILLSQLSSESIECPTQLFQI